MTSDVSGGTTYYFRVRAENQHGYGSYSSTIGITAAFSPDQPSAPTLAVNSDVNVRISWAAPDDNSATITSYTIQILQSDGTTFSEDSTNCDGSSTTIKNQRYCDVPFTTLRASPYSLTLGTDVIAKVLATNSIGSSAYSDNSAAGTTI